MTAEHAKPIKHPPKMPLFLVRGDFIGICSESPSAYCAGTLLGIFEYWTIHLQKQNRSATQLPWVYKSQQSLKDDTLGAFGLNTIHKNLQWLVDNGYLKRRRNPKNRWDKTWQYQLAVDIIQPAIDKWCDENADTLNVNDRDIESEVSADQSEVIENRDSKAAIQESFSESTKRVQHPAPQPAIPNHSPQSKRSKQTKSSNTTPTKTTLPQHTLVEGELGKIVAGLCYPNLPAAEVLADGDEARAIRFALKSIRVKTPALLVPEVFEQWGEWWRQHDFRGQRHQTPTPRQIVDTWMTFRNWRRGKAQQHQALPTAIDRSLKRFDPITGTYIDTRRKSDGIVTTNA